MNTLDNFFAGATIMAAFVIAEFFWRFYRRSRQSLFACFALAFVLLGVERACLTFISSNPHSAIYLIRLCAFLLILYGIVERNRAKPPAKKKAPREPAEETVK